MSANYLEGVSYIQALLPPLSIREGVEIDTSTRIYGGECTLQRLSVNLLLVKLFLKITQETALALKEAGFKKFDALVRNFGCQITAHQVFQLVQNEALFEEAQRVMTIVESKFAQIEKIRAVAGLVIKQNFRNNNFSFEEMATSLELNFTVSVEFSQLIRLRALSIVNLSVVITNTNGRKIEVPKTKPESLQRLVKGKAIKFLPTLVYGLQAVESRNAVSHIQVAADNLSNSLERRTLLQRAVSSERVRESIPISERTSPILSLPLLHNTEISLRGISSGVILVKNKLFTGEERVEGAVETKLFLNATTHLPLSAEKVASLAAATPLFVIEGYIFDFKRLEKILTEGGLIRVLNANCAVLNQYGAKTSQEDIEDFFVQEDINQYKLYKEIPETIFEVDHVFCSSVRVER